MFGIRKALKRVFSIESMTTAVERKIASDMAANPDHPRNTIGGELIGAIQSVRAQAVARRELESLLPEYNRRAAELKQSIDHFNSQTPEWQEAHPEVREGLDAEYKFVSETSARIQALIPIAKASITTVTIHKG